MLMICSPINFRLYIIYIEHESKERLSLIIKHNISLFILADISKILSYYRVNSILRLMFLTQVFN